MKQADHLGYQTVPSDTEPWTYWTKIFFTYLTIVVMLGLIIHMLLDVWRYYRKNSGGGKSG